ncbi:MAG: Uma2 family endonuclease [Deltaproteobacteria bacterium]|nr:Uma2 family endonuclease [Deltaproteobacteria bacterium]
MDTARRKATYEDLLKVPDTMVAEILDGEMFTTPRPAFPHANAASGIAGDLRGPFHREADGPGQPGGWWILFEPELHLGPDVVVPDLAGWRRARVPRLPSAAFFDVAPDWACEVVSPATAGTDRVRKMRIYARESVGYLWLVEPLAKTLEVYRLETARWVVAGTYGGCDRVRAEPFDAIELDLTRWWLEG